MGKLCLIGAIAVVYKQTNETNKRKNLFLVGLLAPGCKLHIPRQSEEKDALTATLQMI